MEVTWDGAGAGRGGGSGYCLMGTELFRDREKLWRQWLHDIVNVPLNGTLTNAENEKYPIMYHLHICILTQFLKMSTHVPTSPTGLQLPKGPDFTHFTLNPKPRT